MSYAILQAFLQLSNNELLDGIPPTCNLDALSQAIDDKCQSLTQFIDETKTKNNISNTINTNTNNTNTNTNNTNNTNNKRKLNDCLDERESDTNIQDEPPQKKQRICTNNPPTETMISTEPAMITVQFQKRDIYFGLYPPVYWLCGKSSQGKSFHPEEWEATHVELTPTNLLTECHRPLLRLCNIPVENVSSKYDMKYGFSSYTDYDYEHSLSLEYEMSDITKIAEWINTPTNALYEKHIKTNKDLGSYSEKKERIFSYLFFIKEYFNEYKNGLFEMIENTNNLILTKDIIKMVVFPYIYELAIWNDINYLNDHRINQKRWFEYAFFFIQYQPMNWQAFFYENVLKTGKYDKLIKGLMKKRKKMAFIHYKFPKLMEMSLRVYPFSFTSQNIVGFICWAVKQNNENLLQISLDLLDNINAASFWGKVFFQTVKNIEYESMDLFRQICIKMKSHCKGKPKIMKQSFDKFNKGFSNGLKFSGWNEDQLECVKIMQTKLDYDIHSIISICLKNANVLLIEGLLEEEMFDYKVLKQKGYLDEMQDNMSLNTKVLNDFINKCIHKQ